MTLENICKTILPAAILSVALATVPITVNAYERKDWTKETAAANDSSLDRKMAESRVAYEKSLETKEMSTGTAAILTVLGVGSMVGGVMSAAALNRNYHEYYQAGPCFIPSYGLFVGGLIGSVWGIKNL